MRHQLNNMQALVMENFSEVPNGITREDVMRAISDLDNGHVSDFGNSTTYDLVHEGRRYAPKEVMGLAARRVIGRTLKPNEFSGGESSKCFKVLRSLGFTIERKPGMQEVDSAQISELLTKFLEQARGEDLSVRGYLERFEGLRVKVSFGKGNVARIPWIAFLADQQEVNEGIYPVLLYFKEVKQLLLCYGVSETNAPKLTWGDLPGRPTVKQWFQKNHSRLPDRYGASFVMQDYNVDQSIDAEDVTGKLTELIATYKGRLSSSANSSVGTVVPREDVQASVSAFSEALVEAGVSFGAAHTRLIASFLASLLTKPLVILTGLSGSGKTQIAMRFGEWLGPNQLKVIPVRPDWTGSEHLFGYEDGLKPRVNGMAEWSVPLALSFMLQAARDPQRPYVLLLDEMNLAHVERYFADVLSGMESGQPCLPNLWFRDGAWRQLADEPAQIPFPRNLWIVGTVNIDETTYLFSPKVLDRANTFEFRVRSHDLMPDARKPSACRQGDAALVAGLVAMSTNDAWQHGRAQKDVSAIADKLRRLHSILSAYGFEFGHRVFYEALRFTAFASAAGLSGTAEILDRIVFQKILPRLHGSRRRLELPLLALAHFCRDLSDVAAEDRLLALRPEESSEGQSPQLPDAYDKVCRMLRALRTNQFASFTE